MVQRLTLPRKHPYNTKSNRKKIVKTPGGKLRFHYQKKPGSLPKCGDCKLKLKGISAARPKELKSLSKRHKTVTRAYGGSLCPKCVRLRIIRAFLIEEQKIVVKVMKARQIVEKQEKQAKAKATKLKSKKTK
ncbi:unnamed protein product [Gordionus sp. m RMFG-2023]|uniref:uncharacterized protein LOC135926212 n=1 Tax=Gordionus sp. m RMFG-2023 TaxID=3053472 RepID=UPI0030E25BF9